MEDLLEKIPTNRNLSTISEKHDLDTTNYRFQSDIRVPRNISSMLPTQNTDDLLTQSFSHRPKELSHRLRVVGVHTVAEQQIVINHFKQLEEIYDKNELFDSGNSFIVHFVTEQGALNALMRHDPLVLGNKKIAVSFDVAPTEESKTMEDRRQRQETNVERVRIVEKPFWKQFFETFLNLSNPL